MTEIPDKIWLEVTHFVSNRADEIKNEIEDFGQLRNTLQHIKNENHEQTCPKCDSKYLTPVFKTKAGDLNPVISKCDSCGYSIREREFYGFYALGER